MAIYKLKYDKVPSVFGTRYMNYIDPESEAVSTRAVADLSLGSTDSWLNKGLSKWEQLKSLYTTFQKIDSDNLNLQPAINYLTNLMEILYDVSFTDSRVQSFDYLSLGSENWNDFIEDISQIDGLTVTLPSGEVVKALVEVDTHNVYLSLKGEVIATFQNSLEGNINVVIDKSVDFPSVYARYDSFLSAYNESVNMYFVVKKTCELALSNGNATAAEYTAYLSQYTSKLKGQALEFFESMKDSIAQAGCCSPNVFLNVFQFFMDQLKLGTAVKDENTLEFNTHDYTITTSFIPCLKDVAASAISVISTIASIAFGAIGYAVSSMVGLAVNIVSAMKDNSESTSYKINEDAAINAYAAPVYQQVLLGSNSDCKNILIPAIQASDSGYLSINVPGVLFQLWLNPSNNDSYPYDVCLEMYLTPTIQYATPIELLAFFGIWDEDQFGYDPMIAPSITSWTDGNGNYIPKLGMSIPDRQTWDDWFFLSAEGSAVFAKPVLAPLGSMSTTDIIRSLRNAVAVILFWTLLRTANQHGITTTTSSWHPNASSNGWYNTPYRTLADSTSATSWQGSVDYLFANFVLMVGSWPISSAESSNYWFINSQGSFDTRYTPFWQLIYNSKAITLWKAMNPNGTIQFSRLPGSFSFGSDPWPTFEDEVYIQTVISSLNNLVFDVPKSSTNTAQPQQIDGGWRSFNWLLYDSVNAYSMYGSSCCVVYGTVPLGTESFTILPPKFSSRYWVGVMVFGLTLVAVAATAFIARSSIKKRITLKASRRQQALEDAKAKYLSDPSNKQFAADYLRQSRRYNRVARKTAGSCYAPAAGLPVTGQDSNGGQDANSVYAPVINYVKSRNDDSTIANDDLSLYDIYLLISGF